MRLSTKAGRRPLLERLASIIHRASERGRDSVGVALQTEDGGFVQVKKLGHRISAEELEEALGGREAVACVFNCRAEPTTEWLRVRDPGLTQPFVHGGVAVTHNGTVANDRELEAELGVEKPSPIDSSVIPVLLSSAWDGSLGGLARTLGGRLVGSYALVVLRSDKPGVMWLATNYKPLYYSYDPELGAVFASSYDTHLTKGGPVWAEAPVRRVEPYTVVEVNARGGYERRASILGPPGGRALVVCSGGLDSTTTAAHLKKLGLDVTIIHFAYGHLAEERERRAVESVADYLGAPLLLVETSLFKLARRSPLLGEGRVNTRRAGEEGAEFAHEWVPARNLVFLSAAMAVADAEGYDYVAMGTNMEEAGAYPDNEEEMYRLFNTVSPYTTSPGRVVRVVNPVGHMVKHEIVGLGLRIRAPLHLTWSCYLNKERHCGSCGPCYMRRHAFKMNKVRDPVGYELPPEQEEEFWAGCSDYPL